MGLSVFMGSDHLIHPALELGCVGAVTVCSNIAPQLFVEIFRVLKMVTRMRQRVAGSGC
jgi:dihydrodipicolinate synthase/N-acetylneuraminate lyase